MSNISSSQARSNIQRALARVRESHGGTTGGVASNASVKSTSSGGGKNLAEQTREAIFQRMGYSTTTGSSGEIIADKGGKRTVVTRQGNVVSYPKDSPNIKINLGLVDRQAQLSDRKRVVPISQVSNSSSSSPAIIQPSKALRQSYVEAYERPYGSAQRYTTSEIKARAIPLSFSRRVALKSKEVVRTLNNIRKAPINKATQAIQAHEDVSATLKGYANARGGWNKLSKSEKGAAVGAAYVGAIGAVSRGTLVLLQPEEIVKGIGKLITHPIRTVGDLADEFRRSPVNTILEFWAAQKVLSAGGKALSKTSAGQSASNALSSAANKLKASASKIPGASRVASITRAISQLKKAAKSRVIKTKAYNLYKNAARKLSPKRNEALASEYLRKIETNKRAISQYEKIRANTLKELKRSRVPKPERKVLLKNVNLKLKSLRNSNKSLGKSLLKTKVSPTRRAVLRSRVVKEIKAPKFASKVSKIKVPKAKTRVSVKVELRLPKKVTQTLQSLKRKAVLTKYRLTRPVKVLTKAAKARIIKTLVKPTKSGLAKLNKYLRKFNRKIVLEKSKVTAPVKLRLRKAGKAVGKGARAFKRYYGKAKGLQRLRKAETRISAIRLTRKVKTAINKPIRSLRKSYGKLINKVKVGKNTVKIYLNKKGIVLERKFTKILSEINKRSPIKIKVKIVTKDGTTYSWYRGRRSFGKVVRFGKGQARRIRKATTRFYKRSTYDTLSKTPSGRRTVLTLLRKNKVKFNQLSKFARKRMRKYVANIQSNLQKIKSPGLSGVQKAQAEMIIGKLRDLVSQKRTGKFRVNQKLTDTDIIFYTKKLRGLTEGKTFKSTSMIKLRQELLKLRQETIRKLEMRKIPKTKVPVLKKKVNNAVKKSEQAYREIRTSDGQVLLQKLKKAKQKVNKVSQSATKKSAKVSYNEAKSSIKSAQDTILKAAKKANTASKLNVIRTIAAGFGALASLLNASAVATSRKFGGIGIGKTRQGRQQISISKQSTVQKQKVIRITTPKETEKVNQVVNQIINQQPSQIREISYIYSLLAIAGATQLLRNLPSPSIINPGNVDRSLRKYKAAWRAWSKRKSFKYNPDLAALVYRQMATPAQRRKLLKAGRLFTGLERRLITARTRKLFNIKLKRGRRGR